MNGTKAVAKYVSTSGHGGMVAVVSNDYSGTYVKYDDYAALLLKRDALREELRNIAEANYREWDDGVNTPFAFVEWAKSRARALLTEGEQ